MDNLIISEKTLKKLIEKHNITKDDIEQAFANIEGEFLIDKREKIRLIHQQRGLFQRMIMV